MRISILPKSPLGRWSGGLAAASFLLLMLWDILEAIGWGWEGPVFIMLGFAFGISGIASWVTGLISIIKSKERSILFSWGW